MTEQKRFGKLQPSEQASKCCNDSYLCSAWKALVKHEMVSKLRQEITEESLGK